MSDESQVPRYVTFTPDEVMEMKAAAQARLGGSGEETRIDRWVRYLTWGILSLCLALWAVVGFIFWIPLLLRSMLLFTFALSEGMLQGAKPDEAGRILREAVEFYRRGFTVAVDAVFAKPGKKQPREVRLRVGRFVFELVVAAVFWYLVLVLMGIVETSPAEIWNAVRGFPWGDMWGSLVDGVKGLVGGVTGGVAEAPST